MLLFTKQNNQKCGSSGKQIIKMTGKRTYKKQNDKEVDTPCRECQIAGLEHDYLIYCSELGHSVRASNKKCKINKFKKK